MQHTYTITRELPPLGACGWIVNTGIPAIPIGRSNLETVGFSVDINVQAELLEGTGRGQHASGEHEEENGGGWDLHIDFGLGGFVRRLMNVREVITILILSLDNSDC